MNYKEIIESRYNRRNWLELLHDIFGSKIKFWNTPSTVAANEQIAKQALWLGTITLSDEQTISVYEVELTDNVDILRNRRGIRDMLLTAWRGNGSAGAFMLCYRKNESVLRFSYVSEAWRFNNDGDYQKESTDTKRFTYLLGEGHRSRTAIQQFEKLKNSNLALADLTKAFSVDAVSDMFFDGYKRQYERFCQFLYDNKADTAYFGEAFQTWEDKVLRDYVKKMLGRLVFVQFLHRKGWAPNLLDAFNSHPELQDNFLDAYLEPLFGGVLNAQPDQRTKVFRDNAKRGWDERLISEFAAVPYLNGGLFESDLQDPPRSRFPKEYFIELFDFFDQYNFTIDENDPNDAEVGVDPEMLGRIFENLLEDNKDKGAFYTPKEIVQYMCRESLIAYLQTDATDNSHRERLRQFVETQDATILHDAEYVRRKIESVKICDPAIGSGAFPMGLLNELVACREALGLHIDKNANRAEIKKHIIQNSIYGVDIEKGAVDIARLRFWLSLVVDEDEPLPLPNLDYKIMQGNSLAEQYKGVDLSGLTQKKADKTGMPTIFDDMLDVYRKQLRDLLNEYYNNTDHQRKHQLQQLIADNVRQQLAEQRIGVDFGTINLAANDQFFLWHTWFNDVFEKGGFDIVIGNPPYIGEKGHKPLFQTVKSDSSLGKFYLGKMDYFYFFFHLSLNFLKNGQGKCALITTNYYPTATGAKKLRDDFKNRACLLQLINFNECKIFESAQGQHNLITILEKKSSDNKNCKILNTSKKGLVKGEQIVAILQASDESVSVDYVPQKDIYEGENNYIRLTKSTANSEPEIFTKVFLKLATNNLLLGKVANVNAGIMGGCDSLTRQRLSYVPQEYLIANNLQKNDGVFVLDYNNARDNAQLNSLAGSHILKDFYKNSDIKKYVTQNSTSKRIIFSSATNSNEDKTTIQNLLKVFRPILEEIRRINGEKLADWYLLRRGPAHPQIFYSAKIVCPQRSKCNVFGYNEIEWCASADVYFITEPIEGYDLKYILGLLNSKLYYFWLYHRGKRKGEYLELYREPLSEIPIKKASDTEQNSIIAIVDKILAAKEKDPQADTSKLEREIDEKVYELYGLTDEEVKVVEGV